ncbi:30S ribosomal protein S8 [Candidatus Gracilibacteria bacterium]|nr:30S ribosomal protein S8 [Candidatus Gracilibacteria bacterium]
MIDPIADFLTRIRNAQMARQDRVELPYSIIKEQIAQVMQKNNFLKAVHTAKTGKVKVLQVELPEKKLNLKRVSKCGQRIYIGAKDVRKVVNGFGIAVLSTSDGVMTGYEARSRNIGGELLCEIS